MQLLQIPFSLRMAQYPNYAKFIGWKAFFAGKTPYEYLSQSDYLSTRVDDTIINAWIEDYFKVMHGYSND